VDGWGSADFGRKNVSSVVCLTAAFFTL
jgi:hypothetical protein